MPNRKIHLAIIAILVLIFLSVLVGTFSQPAPANVRMTFAGYTMAPWRVGFQNGVFQATNISFLVSNSGARKVRLTFRDYEYASGSSTMFIRPSGFGMLCVLQPGQSTNLVIPMMMHITASSGFYPDYAWRVGFTSRSDWLGKLDRQPKWLQTVVTKVVPNRWMADLSRADVVSDWVTNQEPMQPLPAFNGAQR